MPAQQRPRPRRPRPPWRVGTRRRSWSPSWRPTIRPSWPSPGGSEHGSFASRQHDIAGKLVETGQGRQGGGRRCRRSAFPRRATASGRRPVSANGGGCRNSDGEQRDNGERADPKPRCFDSTSGPGKYPGTKPDPPSSGNCHGECAGGNPDSGKSKNAAHVGALWRIQVQHRCRTDFNQLAPP